MKDWLKSIRKSKSMTQKQVALCAGISVQYYNFIETGKRGSNITAKTAKAIASVLGFDWQKFYEERG